MDYWLGIDCGGTFLKAGIYDAEGNVCAIERINLAVLTPYPGWAERDLDALWLATLNVIKGVMGKTQIESRKIKGIGLSAQGKGLFLLDKNNRPLGNGILSSDRRALAIVQNWQQQQIPEQIYPLTRQTLWTGHPVSLLRWLKEHQRERYDNIGTVLMAHDYLRFKLTGQLGCELTNISESNLYNITHQTYDSHLMDLLGIDEIAKALPPIIKSDEIAGTLLPEIAKLTGLCPDTFVVGGLFDVVATALCAGIKDETQLNAVMGTWSVASVITDKITESPHYPYVYGAHAQAKHYIVHDASPTSAANLEWILKLLYYSDLKTLNYQHINQLIDELPKAGSSIFFLPFLYGSNAGLSMQAGFYGLQAIHQKAHLLQAVYEGVIFSFMTHINRMKQHFPAISVLRATGGPVHSPVWMQMLADISETTVEIPTVEESGCLGAACAAMVGAKIYADFSDIQKKIRPVLTVIEPNTQHFAAYRKKYALYQQLVQALQPFSSFTNEQ